MTHTNKLKRLNVMLSGVALLERPDSEGIFRSLAVMRQIMQGALAALASFGDNARRLEILQVAMVVRAVPPQR